MRKNTEVQLALPFSSLSSFFFPFFARMHTENILHYAWLFCFLFVLTALRKLWVNRKRWTWNSFGYNWKYNTFPNTFYGLLSIRHVCRSVNRDANFASTCHESFYFNFRQSVRRKFMLKTRCKTKSSYFRREHRWIVQRNCHLQIVRDNNEHSLFALELNTIKLSEYSGNRK